MQSPGIPLMPDAAEIVHRMTPVFVFAPTARNGVTLVQRLLNSSKQIIVYGENYDFTERLPALAHSCVKAHLDYGPAFEASRRRFRAGETEYWSSDLWPDSQAMMMIGLNAFFQAAILYQQSAERCNRDRWGLKTPVTNLQTLERLGNLMPNARFVFVYRDLFAVARSAKARRLIDRIDQLEGLAAQWCRNVIGIAEASGNETHLIRYELLTAHPETTIRDLEAFAGVTGIDCSVMQRRINTFVGSRDRGDSPTGYIEPEDLTAMEVEVIQQVAGETMQKFGYSPAPGQQRAA